MLGTRQSEQAIIGWGRIVQHNAAGASAFGMRVSALDKHAGAGRYFAAVGSPHRFEALTNAICTPHPAAWTNGPFARRYASICHNINRLAQGQLLHNVVHGDAAALVARCGGAC